MSKLVSVQVKGISKFRKRRLYDPTCRESGYMESDWDFVKNNMELCIEFLETLEKRKPK